MTERCTDCRLRELREHDKPVMPDFKKGSSVLFLSDFPMVEDLPSAMILSGLHRRTAYIHRLIKETGLDQDKVSHATVIRCITRSKAILKKDDYLLCGQHILDDLRSHPEIKAVLCFGSLAGRLLTGLEVGSIEKSRGQIFESVIPGTFCVVTYSLGILVDGSGCGGCGTNVQPFLTKKDVHLLTKELRRRTDEERTAKAKQARKDEEAGQAPKA